MSKPSSHSPDLPYEAMSQVRDHCLCLHTRRAARALGRHFDEAFRPLGLTNGQYSLMMAMNRPEPPAIGFIAAFFGMDHATMTAMLKPLQRRDLVELTPDPADGRRRLMTLTPEGWNLLERAYPVWKKAHAEIEKPLSGDRLRTDLRVLARLEQVD